MLCVRYCAFFPVDSATPMAIELVLSLLTLERQVSPYVEMSVVIYTLSAHAESHRAFWANLAMPTRVIALDTEYAEDFVRWQEIASTIKHKTKTDELCIIRMLADFHILPTTDYRLLIGTDVFFLDVPQELLRFVWSDSPEAKVLYMVDAYSFAGSPYRLRYYHPPILDGLVGDFYCLAPGVTLKETTIHSCLKMIDAWPTAPSRWQPENLLDMVHACEQQAAAILLESFGGQALPLDRYSHIGHLRALAVLHSHDSAGVINTFDITTRVRLKEIISFWEHPMIETSGT